jgi:hypothetical protein
VFLFVCHRPHAHGPRGGPLRADDDLFLDDRDDLLGRSLSSFIAGTPWRRVLPTVTSNGAYPSLRKRITKGTVPASVSPKRALSRGAPKGWLVSALTQVLCRLFLLDDVLLLSGDGHERLATRHSSPLRMAERWSRAMHTTRCGRTRVLTPDNDRTLGEPSLFHFTPPRRPV